MNLLNQKSEFLAVTIGMTMVVLLMTLSLVAPTTVLGEGEIKTALYDLGQWDGATLIPEGTILRHPYISSFSAYILVHLFAPYGRLQVELRRFEEPFTGTDDGGILTSDSVYGGGFVRVPAVLSDGSRPAIQLSDGKYHWRARAVDNLGNASPWHEFGSTGNVDFEILTNQSPCEGLCITNINPESGAPGITAIIEGKNFNSGIALFNYVYFGSSGAEVIDWEDNKIVVKVPFGEQTVDVKVSTLASDSNKVPFTYNEPFIDNLQPQNGNTNTLVEIQGNDFGIKGISSLFKVKFGKSNAITTTWEDKEILTKPPSDYGTGKNDRNFLYCLATATVSGLFPAVFEIDKIAIESCAEWLFELAINDVNFGQTNGEITVDVKVTTPAGESNTKPFTYELLPMVQADLNSPGELRVYDSQGRISGMIQGEMREEIPVSLYDSKEEIVVIPMANDQYFYEVIGIENDTYNLNLLSVGQATTTLFKAIDIPITIGEVHRYIIDWENLKAGGRGAVMNIDTDGDGIIEHKVYSDGELTQEEVILQTKTTIDFDPDTLNVKNGNGLATVYIELPAGYDVNTIDTKTIKLNNIAALEKPTNIGDYDNDGTPDLMIKFDRSTIIKTLSSQDDTALLTVMGNMLHNDLSLFFKGEDVIKIVGR